MAKIVVAGSILLDKINQISSYPNAGELTQIHSIELACGGCVPNVAIDLKTIMPQTQVYALGKVGDDQEKDFIFNAFKNKGVDFTGVVVDQAEKTSFTEVMSVKGGQRTFFTYAGASAKFGYEDIDFDNLSADMFHLGYFLLLDKVDNGDGEKILKKVKQLGIKTSIDLVSENSDRYAKVLPCLKYTDNLIINEVEAGRLVGIEPTNQNLQAMASSLKQMGVSERVIIHQPENSVCLSNDGFTILPSYQLPDGFIKGTTGAGDAFCAGALLGISQGLSDIEVLKLANISAINALSTQDAVSGLKPIDKMVEVCKNLTRKELTI